MKKPGKDVILYAAGFFDGEGTVSAASGMGTTGRRVQCSICQVDVRPLEYLCMFFDGTIAHRNHTSKRHNGIWVWSLSGENARNFLRAIYPYTIVKRGDIKSAFETAEYDLKDS